MKKIEFYETPSRCEACQKASLDFLYIIWYHINVDFRLPMPIFRVWGLMQRNFNRSVAFEVYSGVARGARICRFSVRLRVLPLDNSACLCSAECTAKKKRFALMATSDRLRVRYPGAHEIKE